MKNIAIAAIATALLAATVSTSATAGELTEKSFAGHPYYYVFYQEDGIDAVDVGFEPAIEYHDKWGKVKTIIICGKFGQPDNCKKAYFGEDVRIVPTGKICR